MDPRLRLVDGGKTISRQACFVFASKDGEDPVVVETTVIGAPLSAEMKEFVEKNTLAPVPAGSPAGDTGDTGSSPLPPSASADPGKWVEIFDGERAALEEMLERAEERGGRVRVKTKTLTKVTYRIGPAAQSTGEGGGAFDEKGNRGAVR